MRDQSLDTVNRLAEQVGGFMRHWGFKAVHGRIWTHLYLSPEPLDARELMRRLKISKALVSISMMDLVSYGVVRAAGKSARDTQLYEANPEVRDVIVNVLKAREQKMLSEIEQSFQGVNKDDSSVEQDQIKISKKRLEAIGRMIHDAQFTLSTMVQLQKINFGDIKLK